MARLILLISQAFRITASLPHLAFVGSRWGDHAAVTKGPSPQMSVARTSLFVTRANPHASRDTPGMTLSVLVPDLGPLCSRGHLQTSLPISLLLVGEPETPI